MRESVKLDIGSVRYGCGSALALPKLGQTVSVITSCGGKDAGDRASSPHGCIDRALGNLGTQTQAFGDDRLNVSDADEGENRPQIAFVMLGRPQRADRIDAASREDENGASV